MGNLAIKEPPEFQEEIHQVEEEEYLTAEIENGIKGALLNNDVYLKRKIEEILENIEINGDSGEWTFKNGIKISSINNIIWGFHLISEEHYATFQSWENGSTAILIDIDMLNRSILSYCDINVQNCRIMITSKYNDYGSAISQSDCIFRMMGRTSAGGSYSPFMSVDLDSNEMTIYGDLILREGYMIYIGPNIALSMKKINNIPTTNFGAISIDINADPAKSGIYFSDGVNKPLWQIVQSQHVAQGEWFLNFNFYDSNHTNKKRIVYLGESEVHFEVPVTASNITKMANELKLAQQEITEQDLQLIETQQMLTEQELENIETQQMLTEMDLEKIEGGQGL